MKQILIIIIFLLINTNSFADKRLEKDLKKLDVSFPQILGTLFLIFYNL